MAVPISEERRRIQGRVGRFDWKNSQIWFWLALKFGEKVTHEELVSIAGVIAKWTNIRLDRDAKRRKMVMMKWFEEHWATIFPLLPAIVLV
jgi:hypothetical protein